MADTTQNFYDDYDGPPENEDDPLGLIGRVIAGKYQIDAFIGEGGFGKVYTGHNIKLVAQKVVIKFFTEARLKDRFEQEAEIISKLSHPGICSLIDYLADERALVIPFIDGIDLHRQLKEHGPLPADQFIRVGNEILEAIEFAHGKSIAHRDIKPSNIMIGRNNNVYLIDFGIAKEIKEDSSHTTVFMGTPDFAAPERQQRKSDYNPFLSDIFELGVTMFYLATRTHLYQDRDYPDARDWNLPHTRKISGKLRRILKKATQPDPALRYQSISEMAADFRRVKHPYHRTVTPVRVLAVAAVVAVLILAGDYVNQKFDLTGLPALVSWFPETAPDSLTTTSSLPPAGGPVFGGATVGDTLTVEDTATTPIEPVSASIAEIPGQPVTPRVKIDVLPPGLVHLEVDGREQPAGQPFEIERGQHEIVIEHEDFPIYSTVASIASDTATLTFDLNDRLRRLDSAKVLLVILPRDDRYGFDFFCNGKVYDFSRPREFAFHLRNGLWNIGATVKPLDSTVMDEPQVDSIVVGVMGKTQTEVIHGNRGQIDVSSGPAGDQIMRLLIYWSDSQQNVRR